MALHLHLIFRILIFKEHVEVVAEDEDWLLSARNDLQATANPAQNRFLANRKATRQFFDGVTQVLADARAVDSRHRH
jgi:hypothetical protein